MKITSAIHRTGATLNSEPEHYFRFLNKICKNNDIYKLSVLYCEIFIEGDNCLSTFNTSNLENVISEELIRLLVCTDSYFIIGVRKNFCLEIGQDGNSIEILHPESFGIPPDDKFKLKDNTQILRDTDAFDLEMKAINRM